MSSRLLLLVDPTSDAGKPEPVAALKRALRTAGYVVEVHRTTSAEDVERVAAAARPDDVVAVLGGDGTTAVAARGVLQAGALLLPLPGGRGNDFCAALGITGDPVTVAQRIAAFVVRPIDVGRIDDHLFLTVATIGFDSVVNGKANASRLHGSSVYAVAAMRTLATWRGADFSLIVDGEPMSYTGWSAVIGNTAYYGGGMKICPRADPADGRLDLLTSVDTSATDFLKVIRKVFTGDHLRHPKLAYHQVEQVRIESVTSRKPKLQEQMVVYADGDPVTAPPCTISVQPAALRVLAPPLPSSG